MENITLEKDTVFLRILEPEDLPFLQIVENNPEYWDISHTIQPFSSFTLKQYIAQAHQDIYNTQQQRWVICNKKDHNTLGFLDLYDFDPRNARVGIGIIIANKEDRQKKIASQAIEIIINYCFNHLFVNQIFVNILTDNKPSIHLFSKFGFELIGIKKQWIRIKNQFKDEAMYQLISPTK